MTNIPDIIASYQVSDPNKASWTFHLDKAGDVSQLLPAEELQKKIDELETNLEDSGKVIAWLYYRLKAAQEQAIWGMQTEQISLPKPPPDLYGTHVDEMSHCYGSVEGTHNWLPEKPGSSLLECFTCGCRTDAEEEGECCGDNGFCCTGQNPDKEDTALQKDSNGLWSTHTVSPHAELVSAETEDEKNYEYGIGTHAEADAEVNELLDDISDVNRSNFMCQDDE